MPPSTDSEPASSLEPKLEKRHEKERDEERGTHPFQSEKEEEQSVDPNLVDWDANDPENPRNWSQGYKCWVTLQLGMLALCASLGSSIIAPAQSTLSEYVGVSSELGVLSVSLYILGFAFGPLCWAPISEIWGRRMSMLPAVFCLGLFSIATATSQNASSIFVSRYFAGLFGSAPVSNVAAALGDIWHQKARGVASTFYGICVVGGPTIGPTIGSALLVTPSLGWRWTEYIQALWVFTTVGIAFFALPEIYAPILLSRRAKRLRNETGNQSLYHPHEHIDVDFKSIFTKHFSRPLVMLCTEPMVTVIAMYASFVYALLYLTLEVFPIVFEEIRGYSPVVGSLPFMGLFIGVIGSTLVILSAQKSYIRQSEAAQGRPVPEARLPPMAVGAVMFAIALFWFGWTADPRFSWSIPTVATVFIGCGFSVIFGQCINFLVDTYGLYAASAVAANTFLRSVMAAGFPLAAKPMFHTLGVGPAVSILGAIATVAIPVPFLFMKYGLTLRRKSKFAPVIE